MRLVTALSVIVSAASAFSPSCVLRSNIISTKLHGEGEYGASSTSVYTDVQKKESYEALDSVLNSKCKDPKVRQVIKDMLNACADITEALRSALVTVEGSMNDFGDAQLSVDVSTSGNPVPNNMCCRFISEPSTSFYFVLLLYCLDYCGRLALGGL